MAVSPCDVVVEFHPPGPVNVSCGGEPALVVEFVPPEQVIVEVSAAGGLPGPPGPPGTGMAVTDKPAARPLGGHRAVYLTPDNDLDYADHTDPQTVPTLLGITTQATTAGDTPTVVVYGDLTEGSWTWTPGQYVYLGANGQLTQTPPTTGTAYILATAVTATHIFVNIREPIALF